MRGTKLGRKKKKTQKLNKDKDNIGFACLVRWWENKENDTILYSLTFTWLVGMVLLVW